MTPDLYAVQHSWESELGHRLGFSDDERVTQEFWSLWTQVLRELGAKGTEAGPSGFKGWNDGDAGFVRAIWPLVCHLKPTKVVETGVGHGVTSRFILEGPDGMARVNFGALTVRPWKRNSRNMSASPSMSG